MKYRDSHFYGHLLVQWIGEDRPEATAFEWAERWALNLQTIKWRVLRISPCRYHMGHESCDSEYFTSTFHIRTTVLTESIGKNWQCHFFVLLECPCDHSLVPSSLYGLWCGAFHCCHELLPWPEDVLLLVWCNRFEICCRWWCYKRGWVILWNPWIAVIFVIDSRRWTKNSCSICLEFGTDTSSTIWFFANYDKPQHHSEAIKILSCSSYHDCN